MPLKLRSVLGSYNGCILLQPFAESCLPRCRLLRHQQIRHQSFDFLTRENQVAHDQPHEAKHPQGNAWIHMEELRPGVNPLCNQPDEVPEGEDFRTDGIEHQIALLPGGINSQLSDVLYENRLDLISPRPRNREHGKETHKASYVAE